MTSKVKERVITMSINAVITIATVFLAFGLNANKDNSKEIEKKINSKLDKNEFSEYRIYHEKRHEQESVINEKFLQQLDKRFEQQNEAIDKRFQDLKDYLKKIK